MSSINIKQEPDCENSAEFISNLENVDTSKTYGNNRNKRRKCMQETISEDEKLFDNEDQTFEMENNYSEESSFSLNDPVVNREPTSLNEARSTRATPMRTTVEILRKNPKISRRICKAPYKRWTDAEQGKLIAFLKNNQPIEKPTAQKYYRRFIAENGFNIEWNLIRSKVKNMRQTYCKLKALQNSLRWDLKNDIETINDLILRKCPMFPEYDKIFVYKEGTFQNVILDTESSNAFELNTQEHSDVSCSNKRRITTVNECGPHQKSTVDEDFSQENKKSVAENIEKTSTREKPQTFEYSYSGLSDLLQIQSLVVPLWKDLKQQDVKLKEAELELQKQKFLFEKEKHSQEIQLKYKQLTMERKLRIMEMKMKKEIAFKEIESKEKLEMEKLRKM